jgi:hypothetical protein
MTTTMPDSMLALVFGPKKAAAPSPLQAVAETAKQVISTATDKASAAVAAVVEAQVIPLRGGGAVVASGDPAAPALVVPTRKTRRAKAPNAAAKPAAKNKTAAKAKTAKTSTKKAAKSPARAAKKRAKKAAPKRAAKTRARQARPAAKKKAAKRPSKTSRSKSRTRAKSRR